MNILPKKRWHVRSKDNIARVRRDEAKAAEDEKKRLQKSHLAEQEARTCLLRNKARAIYDGRSLHGGQKSQGEKEHINFFKELEDGEYPSQASNEEYEKEKREAMEKYEKQIGYLSYLVDNKNEVSRKCSWYEKIPGRHPTSPHCKEENYLHSKSLIDPYNKFKSIVDSDCLSTSKNKNTTKESHQSTGLKEEKNVETSCEMLSSTSWDYRRSYCSTIHSQRRKNKRSPSMEELQLKRLKREKEEKIKATLFLAQINGGAVGKNVIPPLNQKYNSQFNPDIAKQNFSKH